MDELEGNKPDDNPFSCHICLEPCTEPVVTTCGHLFCWPCIYRWLEQPHGVACPVCKAGISKEKLVPIYGKGRESDPREHTPTPQRPQGQRTEPEYPTGFQRDFGNQFGNFHVAFGPGLINFFGSTGGGIHFNNFGGPPRPQRPLTPEEEKELFAKMMLFIGSLILALICMM